MSNNLIFISGLSFSGGFEKDDPISFYTQENIILDISHHCDKMSHRSSWGGEESTLDYGFSPGMCSGDSTHPGGSKCRELMLAIELSYNPWPILSDSPLPAMPLVS